MKRALCLIFVLALLTGCVANPGSQSTADDTTATTPTTLPDVQITVPEQRPLVCVSLPVETEETKAEDGTVLLRHTYQHMELIIPDPEIADAVILDFLSRTDTEDSALSMSKLAEDAYSANPNNWLGYLIQTTYAPMRIDNGVLSLFGSHATFTGGAHADTVYQAVSYDLVTGNVISLNDILTDKMSAEVLAQLVIDSLTAQKVEKNIWDGFEDAVRSRFGASYLQDRDWFFSTTGLCFFFPPYEIGPYSSGAIVAEIPYEKLAGLCEDAYFPGETEPAYGKLEATVFTDDNAAKYSQIGEVILTEDGEKFLLHTELSVQNITIELGHWSADGTSFAPQHTVFAALALTPGDAVMVQCDLSQSLPPLRITYRSNDKIFQEYVTLNPTDHSVSLAQ